MDSVNGLFYEKDRWNYQHTSLRSNIQQSTFPHQPKAGGSPFLSRTGNVLCSFHLDANAFLRSFAFSSSTILPYAPTLWNQLSTRQTAEAVCRQLFYAIPRRIVNRQKLHRRKAPKILPSLEREGKGRKLCLLSANSYGIWEGVKQNVFFLQSVRMQKLINESMRTRFPLWRERRAIVDGGELIPVCAS